MRSFNWASIRKKPFKVTNQTCKQFLRTVQGQASKNTKSVSQFCANTKSISSALGITDQFGTIKFILGFKG